MNWFTNLFKSSTKPTIEEEEVVVVPEVPKVVKVSNGAPQVKDYPRDKYKAYWETFYEVNNNRHEAKVRFCDFKGNVLSSSSLTSGSKEALFEKVHALIKAKMDNFKR